MIFGDSNDAFEDNQDEQAEFDHSLRSLLYQQLYSVITINPIKIFISLWRELDQLQSKNELKVMKTHYHKTFVRTCWNYLFSFGVVLLLILLVCVLTFQEQVKEIQYIQFIIPGFIIVLFIIDIIIKMYNQLIEYVLFGYLVLFGLNVVYENLWFEEYRYHEIWIIYDCAYMLLWIAFWFKWKNMVILYWIIKSINVVTLVLKHRSKIVIYYYFGIGLSSIAFPLVWMVTSKIILGLLEYTQNNK